MNIIKTFESYINESIKLFKNPKFLEDFSGSKVVDTNDNPLLMYHGGSFSGGEFKGIGWFTSNKSDAKYYAKQNGGSVTSAYLVIKNPLYSGDVRHLGIKATPEILKACKKRNITIAVKRGIIQYIETNNATLIAQDIDCDGVIDIHNGEILDAVIFSGNQLLLPTNY
jgi:hypothetical protein